MDMILSLSVNFIYLCFTFVRILYCAGSNVVFYKANVLRFIPTFKAHILQVFLTSN